MLVPRKPSDDEVDFFGLTHCGSKRDKNEDQFLICSLNKNIQVHASSIADLDPAVLSSERMAFLAVVADGVGGNAGGAVASRMALETVTHYIAHSTECYYRHAIEQEHGFLEHLRTTVAQCHSAILEEAAADTARAGMATTLTLLLTSWPHAYVIQVGDSRCYRLRGDQLSRTATGVPAS